MSNYLVTGLIVVLVFTAFILAGIENHELKQENSHLVEVIQGMEVQSAVGELNFCTERALPLNYCEG